MSTEETRSGITFEEFEEDAPELTFRPDRFQASPSARAAAAPVDSGAVFESRVPWRAEEPNALVIACSDGRIDEQLDEFLQQHLRLVDYERVYLPGGPGSLSGSACEYTRADQVQRECGFLVEAHKVEEVVLIFHGAAEGGPDEAVCGDYRRKYATASCQDLNRQQETDLVDALRSSYPWLKKVRVRAFRAEVAASRRVRFVPLDT
jgi:hypothetical protein